MLVNLYVCNITLVPAADVGISNFPNLPSQGRLERISVKCTDGTNGGNTYDFQAWSGMQWASSNTEGAVAQQMIDERGITALGIGATGAEVGSADFTSFPGSYFCAFTEDLSVANPAALGGMGLGTWTLRIDTGGAGNGKTFQIGMLIRSPEVSYQKDGESYPLFQELS